MATLRKVKRLLRNGVRDLAVRGADLSVNWIERGESGEIADGDAAIIFSRGMADGETLQISHASFLLSNGMAAPTGTSLRIITLDNAGGGTSEVTIASGDGATVQDDLSADRSGDAIGEYKNTSGDEETVALVVDNGEFGAGTGSTEDMYSGVTGRVRSDI